MERANFNILNNSCNLPVGKPKPQAKSAIQNYRQSAGIYPIYTEIPYGINKKTYFKIAESQLPTGETAHIYKLISGQIVSVVQKPDGCPIIATTFKVGASDEPEGKEGISHLIEHSIYHKSSKYDDLDSAIKSVGGITNASTDEVNTRYYIKLSDAKKETLEKALDIEADMLFKPEFSKVESKEKAIVIKEAKESEADEFKVSIKQCIKNLFSIDRPDIKNPVTGSEKSINSITVDDIKKYHNEFYIPSNCSTSIVSPLNPDEVMEIASKKFLEASGNISNRSITRKKFAKPNSIKRNDLISTISPQKSVLVAFRLPDRDLSNEINLRAFGELLRLRGGIANVLVQSYGGESVLIMIGENKDEYDFFEKIKEAIVDIGINPISDFDLASVKNTLFEENKANYMSNEQISDRLAKDCLKNMYDYSLRKKYIENLSENSIKSAQNNLDLDKCAIQVLHPKGTSQKDLDEALNKYKNYITPVQISRQATKLNVSDKMESYNISPYSATPAKSTTLPDNTRFVVINNSKTDDCRVVWELYNPNLASANPTAKYLLENLYNSINTDDKLFDSKNGVNLGYSFLNVNRAVVDLRCKKENLAQALKQVKKAITLDFNEKDFEASKSDVADAIKSSSDDSSYGDFLADKLGVNRTTDKDKLLEYLEKLTFNDVKKYYNELIKNSYSTLCARLPFEKDPEIINTVASEINTPNLLFKAEDDKKFVKAYKNDAPKTYIKEENQPKYETLYTFKTNGNKTDSLKFKLLNSVLKDRIYNDLREKQQLGYRAGASFDEHGDMSTISAYIVTDHKDKSAVDDILKQLKKHIRDISTKPITEKELKEAKAELKTEYFDIEEVMSNSPDDSNYDSVDEINYVLKTPNGLSQMQNNIQIIDSITTDDILKAAQYAFKNSPNYLIDTDKESIEKYKNYFNSLTKTEAS